MSNAARPGSSERAGRILARLAHRFADREAILWRGGLDEERWSSLEQDLLRELENASPGDLAEFARVFLDARRELTRGIAPPPSTLAAPVLALSASGAGDRSSVTPISEESVPTVPKGSASPELAARFASTAPLGTIAKIESPPTGESLPGTGAGADDEDALSATLYSGSARAPGSAPRTK